MKLSSTIGSSSSIQELPSVESHNNLNNVRLSENISLLQNVDLEEEQQQGFSPVKKKQKQSAHDENYEEYNLEDFQILETWTGRVPKSILSEIRLCQLY